MKNMRSVLNEIIGEDLSPGETLRALRVEKGISQDQLQNVTGIARTNISALENERLEMTSHYAILFAAALGVHPSEILFPNGKYVRTDEVKNIEEKAKKLFKKHAAG